jgi:hypothetical protein
MAMSLEEALRDVELVPGRTYRCRIRDQWVELRVGEPSDAEGPIDPWVELPKPKSAGTVRAKLGPPDPPDIPPMPGEDAP